MAIKRKHYNKEEEVTYNWEELHEMVRVSTLQSNPKKCCKKYKRGKRCKSCPNR